MFDDLNHVIDAFTITKKSKNCSSKSKLISFFTFIKIINLIHELDQLFIYVIFTSYNVFNLFFNDDILYKFTKYINEYATKYVSKKNKSFVRK